jgi:hypothetical protein
MTGAFLLAGMPIAQPPGNLGRIKPNAANPVSGQTSGLDALVQGFRGYPEQATQFVNGDQAVEFLYCLQDAHSG